MSSVRVEIDEIIECPVERAFERATDLSHYADWMPHGGVFKRSSQLSDGPVGPGTKYIDQGRLGRFRGGVAEFQKPSRVVFDERLRWFGARAIEARIEYEFRAVPQGTALHHVAESELHGLFRLMRPMVARVGRSERERTVNALKRSLESERAGSGQSGSEQTGTARAA
jgi:uncharacterized protein YndB with AHSA1/START domain